MDATRSTLTAAAEAVRALHRPTDVAGTLATLGDTHRDLGEREHARQCWQEAIDLYRRQNLHLAADRIAQRSQ